MSSLLKRQKTLIADAEIDSETFSGSIKFTFQLMKSRRMRWLLPQIFWTGISIAYWSGLAAIIIVRTIPDKDSSE